MSGKNENLHSTIVINPKKPMHKLKIGEKGLREAAELENGCDISAGILNEEQYSIEGWLGLIVSQADTAIQRNRAGVDFSLQLSQIGKFLKKIKTL